MRAAVADQLEDFVERDGLADAATVAGLVDQLEAETRHTGDPNPSRLAAALSALLPHLGGRGLPARTAHEVEAIVYPRLWKVMEAARSGLPAGELRTRIEALDRHVSRRLGEETAP
jgi:hypothetical protein